MPPASSPELEFRHPPPRKNVLLLSCMDVRLLDDTVAFMDKLNLANRYDQVVFAGVALGVLRLGSPAADDPTSSPRSLWRDVFFHHLKVAIDDLKRDIKDVYILEHRDCGAYRFFHPTHREPYADDEAGQRLEERHHREQAFELAGEIREFCREQQRRANHARETADGEIARAAAEARRQAWEGINVRCFLMDLVGDVKHLRDPDDAPDGAGASRSAGTRPRRAVKKRRG